MVLGKRLQVLVSAVRALRPQQLRVTIITNVLNLEEACLRSVKSKVAFKAAPLLVLSRLETAIMVQVAVLVPGQVAENRVHAPVVAADALVNWHRPIEETETHFSSASRIGWSLCLPFGMWSTMKR
jgi:hypothetical protein